MVALRGDRHILSVDWDQRELRIVQAALHREAVRVEDVLAVSIPQDVSLANAAEVGALLRRVLDEERIGGRRVIANIPRDQAVLQTLSLPAAAVSDLAGMVEVQIAKSLPFPVSEAVVDFAVPPDDQEAEGPRDVLVGAVRNEVLDYYRQVCESAGLRLDRVGLRPYATKVAVNASLAGEEPERVLVVDVGPVLTEIDVLHRGQLVFSRAASVYVPGAGGSAGPMPSPAEPERDEPEDTGDEPTLSLLSDDLEAGPRGLTAVVADLMVEVTRSLEAYRATAPGMEMDRVVVAGGTGIEDTLAEAVQRRFGVTAEVYNPAGLLDGDAERGAAASGFAAALGLALGHAGEGRLHFNFLDPKKPEDPGRARLRKVPLVAAAAALLIAAGVVWYVQVPGKQFARVAELEDQIRDVKQEIRKNRDFISLVETARQWEEEQVVWLEEMKNLQALLPDNKHIVLNGITMRQADRRIDLAVRAADNRQPARIIRRLQEFRIEGEQEPRYVATRGATAEASRGGKYPHESDITLRLADGEDEARGKKSRRKR